VAIGLRKYK